MPSLRSEALREAVVRGFARAEPVTHTLRRPHGASSTLDEGTGCVATARARPTPPGWPPRWQREATRGSSRPMLILSCAGAVAAGDVARRSRPPAARRSDPARSFRTATSPRTSRSILRARLARLARALAARAWHRRQDRVDHRAHARSPRGLICRTAPAASRRGLAGLASSQARRFIPGPPCTWRATCRALCGTSSRSCSRFGSRDRSRRFERSPRAPCVEWRG